MGTGTFQELTAYSAKSVVVSGRVCFLQCFRISTCFHIFVLKFLLDLFMLKKQVMAISLLANSVEIPDKILEINLTENDIFYNVAITHKCKYRTLE